jgi:hypothetical protein
VAYPRTLSEFSRGRRAAIVATLGGLWTIGPFSIDLYLPALPTLGGDLAASQRQVAVPIMRDAPADDANPNVGGIAEPTAAPGIPAPPEALLWLNPVVAAADVICGTDVNPYSMACQLIGSVTGEVPGGGVVLPGVKGVPEPEVIIGGNAKPGGANGWGVVGRAPIVAGEVFTSSSTRDTFWPKAAVAWAVTSALLVLVTVQLVSPTRRWRIFRRRSPRGTQA